MSAMQSPDKEMRQQRIDIRTSAKIKTALNEAADLSGISMSAFVLAAAYEKAKSLLHSQENITLSDVERDKFLTLLEGQPRSNPTLKRAMKRYLNRQKNESH